MAIIILRGSILHLQWYDPVEKKVKTKSTGLTPTPANVKKVRLYANKLQHELTSKNKKLKEIGIQRISIQDAFNHLLRNNQEKHPKTIIDYHRFFNKFKESFDPEKPCSEINKMNVEAWLNKVKKLPMAKNSIHNYGKQLVHFLNFLFEYNYTSMFRINKDVRTKAELKEKITFTDQDITDIFSNLQKKNSNFQTVIHILFYTGLRPTDIFTIRVENINLNERILRYYSPKRDRYREIPFHKDLVKIIKKRVTEIKEGPLVRYARTEGLGYQILKYFEKIGLGGKKYSARTFRKTFITLCRSRFNIDASIVRQLVGHQHLNTTDRYYNEIGIKTMRDALDKFKRPVVKKKKAGS